ncbi:MAG: acyl-CoA dehydrogenase family protein [Pseudomonadota bacterium]|nr:acyl-CoA dehydrogenase family protein [Pseudomonadota bacterium]
MYKAPLTEYEKILKQFAENHPEYDMDTMVQILKAVSVFCEEALWPTNQIGDQEGLVYDPKTKSVTVSDSFHSVYKTLCENGYASLALDQAYGGGGAPWVLHHLVAEMLASSNLSLTTCPMLTNGALETLIKNASDELKARYVSKMCQGVYSGTMCLTESQCGTDLGLIKTTAKPHQDHYLLSGTKIWITFGEHDLSENIVHLVLAKTPNAPEGTKGISLFVVPKFLPDGTRNQVFCGGLEHKMGQKGSPTAVLNFEEAEGWLVGEEFSGMRAMFQMMNPARIGVGVQGLGMAEVAYQQALSFASQRRQSRSLDPKQQDHSHSADLILVHPDVRRMLMIIESTNIAMRKLIGLCSYHLDQGQEDFVGILTPIVKSYVTEQSMDNVSLAMQVMGGMGYVTDGLCEQYYRDGRITMIYEGTNGIQGLDLIGRKIAKDGGKALSELLATLPVTEPMQACIDQANTYLLTHAGNPEEVAAIATDYLSLLALVIQSALMVKDRSVDENLLSFYQDYTLAEAQSFLNKILAGSSALMQYQKLNDILKDAQ